MIIEGVLFGIRVAILSSAVPIAVIIVISVAIHMLKNSDAGGRDSWES